MNTTYANAFTAGLTLDDVRARAPAVFATSANEKLSQKYTFIPTEKVLDGLMQAGFVPVDARQAHTRKAVPAHARHVLRLRRRYETIQLKDSIPEVVFLNSHDGTSAYQLRMGLFRVVCANGLIASRGSFPGYRASHRGNVVDDVVAGALQVSERFDLLASQVERMEHRVLDTAESLRFGSAALKLRYPEPETSGLSALQILRCIRPGDDAEDLWTTLNRCQENLLRGRFYRHAPSGRLTRQRRITSIREEVRLNSALWDLASEYLAA